MAYKKYIKRGDKIYGPYIYNSKRVGGKVISEYKGTGKKKIEFKKFIWFFLVLVFLALLVFVLIHFKKNISGNALLDITTSHQQGEPLQGVLQLSLNQGELIPASTKIIFEDSEKKYEYPISNFISDKPLNGSFYIKGSSNSLSGNGEGYGIRGVKETYPDVDFTLEIYSEQQNNSEKQAVQGISKENNSEQVTKKIPKGNSSNQTKEKNTTAPGITGNFISRITGRVLGTGNAVLELKKEIDGKVTANESFVYELNSGETAKLKPKSVHTDSEQLPDSKIKLNIKNNKAVVNTDYTNTKFGFGEQYFGDKQKTYSLDLSKLNLSVKGDELKIKLVYNGDEIITLTKPLSQESDQKATIQTINKTPNQTKATVKTNQISSTSLTDEEKTALKNKFGKINVKTIKSEIFNGRLVIGYEIGNYKIEYSYAYPPTNEEAFKIQLQKDLIKWLKDIAQNLLQKQEVAEPVTGIVEPNYSIS